MRGSRMSPIGANIFGIYIDESADGNVRGRISGCGGAQERSFTSLTKMILLVDDLLDQELPPGQPVPRKGTPDFELEILFRQNYSWQGRLRWPAGGKEATFHSVLELIFTMETVLAQTKPPPNRENPTRAVRPENPAARTVTQL